MSPAWSLCLSVLVLMRPSVAQLGEVNAIDKLNQVMLVDPPGSSLFNKVKRGVLYAREEAEGRRLRNPFDTITEGIGINRITANFSLAKARVPPLCCLHLPCSQTGSISTTGFRSSM